MLVSKMAMLLWGCFHLAIGSNLPCSVSVKHVKNTRNPWSQKQHPPCHSLPRHDILSRHPWLLPGWDDGSELLAWHILPNWGIGRGSFPAMLRIHGAPPQGLAACRQVGEGTVRWKKNGTLGEASHVLNSVWAVWGEKLPPKNGHVTSKKKITQIRLMKKWYYPRIHFYLNMEGTAKVSHLSISVVVVSSFNGGLLHNIINLHPLYTQVVEQCRILCI